MKLYNILKRYFYLTEKLKGIKLEGSFDGLPQIET